MCLCILKEEAEMHLPCNPHTGEQTCGADCTGQMETDIISEDREGERAALRVHCGTFRSYWGGGRLTPCPLCSVSVV